MSETYNTFAAAAFGPVLAEYAREHYHGRLTPALRRQTARNWNLTPAALQAVFAEARRELRRVGHEEEAR